MTASLLLHSHWAAEPLMFLYDGGADERGAAMDAFPGGNFAASQCRNLLAHPPSLAPGELPAAGAGEAGRQCSPCSAAQSSPNASLPYGYFGGGSGGGGGGGSGGGGFYPCRLSHGGAKPCAPPPPPPPPLPAAYGDKYAEPPADDFSARAKELAFYQGCYPPAPYPPAYLDAADARHDPLLPAEPAVSYQPWALGGPWGGQAFCAKEQPPAGAPWKSALPDGGPGGDPAARRGRKKRVPYTKAQLKELEKEYAANKFITKDKRRRISGHTGLTERQVTIWFQNRRVKEKKVVSKFKGSGT